MHLRLLPKSTDVQHWTVKVKTWHDHAGVNEAYWAFLWYLERFQTSQMKTLTNRYNNWFPSRQWRTRIRWTITPSKHQGWLDDGMERQTFWMWSGLLQWHEEWIIKKFPMPKTPWQAGDLVNLDNLLLCQPPTPKAPDCVTLAEKGSINHERCALILKTPHQYSQLVTFQFRPIWLNPFW